MADVVLPLALPALLREEPQSGKAGSGASYGHSSPCDLSRRDAGLSPFGGDPTPGRSRGSSVRDVFCPEPIPREFFVNVVLLGEDRSKHATAVAKDHGRSKFGRVGSIVGGVVGSVLGNNVSFDKVIAESLCETVIDSALASLKRQRWWAAVTPMFLPPAPGKTEWQSFVSLGEQGHFMAFRVLVTGRLPDRAEPAGWSLWSLIDGMLATCLAPPTIEDPDLRLAQEIALIQPEINQALRDRKNPFNAHVTIVDAAEQFHTLHELNWSRERSAEAIRAARAQQHGVPAVA